MSILIKHKKIVLSLRLIALAIAGVFPVEELRLSQHVGTATQLPKFLYRVFAAGHGVLSYMTT